MTRKWDPAPRLVLFDLDRGCEIAIRALGGRYFALEAGKPTGLQPDCSRRRPRRAIQFWEQLIRTCIESPSLPLMPADERAIADAVQGRGHDAQAPAPLLDRAAEPAQSRREQPARPARALVPGRRARVGFLTAAKPTTQRVAQADRADDRLLDLDAASVIGFDTTEFLDQPEVRTPVMLYLLQVMEELVDGRRLIYVISEFWKALDHPIFSDFAKSKQKTIRKQNGLGIFDTQSPSDVLRHPIGRTMVEQCVTKIFLANTEAVREEYVEGFGLTEAEYDIVRHLGSQGGRKFLVKQGHASALCELDLAGMDDFITVLSATTDNVALLDAIRARVGDDPFQWLPVLLGEVHDRRIATYRRAG